MKKAILFATFFTAAALAQTDGLNGSPLTETERHELAAKRQQDLAGRSAHVVNRLRSLTQAQDADAAASNPFSNILVQQIQRRPVTWTLDGATCSLVTSAITATGQGKTTVTALQNRDGSINVETLDEVSGTAKDAKGNEYIFLYKFTEVYDTASLFPGPTTYSFTAPDVFELIPTSPGGQGFKINIYFKLKVNADGSFSDLGTTASQDPNCDPI
jgi:hypothetical protein